MEDSAASAIMRNGAPLIIIAEDLTKIMLAIEAVDRALTVARHPYMAADV